jgi:hypothetical protein
VKHISCWRERATLRKKRTKLLWRVSLCSRAQNTSQQRRHDSRARRLCNMLAKLDTDAARTLEFVEYSSMSLEALRLAIMRAIYIGRANVNKSSPI